MGDTHTTMTAPSDPWPSRQARAVPMWPKTPLHCQQHPHTTSNTPHTPRTARSPRARMNGESWRANAGGKEPGQSGRLATALVPSIHPIRGRKLADLGSRWDFMTSSKSSKNSFGNRFLFSKMILPKAIFFFFTKKVLQKNILKSFESLMQHASNPQ